MTLAARAKLEPYEIVSALGPVAWEKCAPSPLSNLASSLSVSEPLADDERS